jgi:ribonuclease
LLTIEAASQMALPAQPRQDIGFQNRNSAWSKLVHPRAHPTARSALLGGVGAFGTGKIKGMLAAPRQPTRFLNSVIVVDKKSGQTQTGTVDLGPTLNRIQSGGSFPHKNDGSTFNNLAPIGASSPLLPVKPKGFYKEYVVPTPAVKGPGPQRIVVGKDGKMYYTPDHYDSFVPLN